MKFAHLAAKSEKGSISNLSTKVGTGVDMDVTMPTAAAGLDVALGVGIGRGVGRGVGVVDSRLYMVAGLGTSPFATQLYQLHVPQSPQSVPSAQTPLSFIFTSSHTPS